MGVVLLLMERCWRGRRPSGRNLAASVALGGEGGWRLRAGAMRRRYLLLLFRPVGK